MIQTIRHKKGQGNATVFLRITDILGNFWDFVNQVWVAAMTTDCKVFFTEIVEAADTKESKYIVNAPNLPPGGPYDAEAVDLTVTPIVLGSDQVMGELTGVPDMTNCSVAEKNQFLAQYFAMKRVATGTNNAGSEIMYDSDGAVIATADLTDDGTTFTKSKFI